jgi:hypothetical protein
MVHSTIGWGFSPVPGTLPASSPVAWNIGAFQMRPTRPIFTLLAHTALRPAAERAEVGISAAVCNLAMFQTKEGGASRRRS